MFPLRIEQVVFCRERLPLQFEPCMHIIVIGCGLIGVTSAYCLGLCGYEVTVLERAEGPARETSFANGSLLTPSMPEPWNSPGCWRTLLSSLGRSGAALQLRLRALPSLAGWGIAFLRHSSRARFEQSVRRNLRLALHSLGVMDSIRTQDPFEFGHYARGTLRIFRDAAALSRAAQGAERLSAEGLRFRVLSTSETIAREPALAPIADQLSGAVHYEADQTGDAYRFCTELAKLAARMGVKFRFGAHVTHLERRSDKVVAVHSERETFLADRYVVAAGSYSAPLLRGIGIRVPVRPAKGYSVTLPVRDGASSLRTPILDDDWHAAIVPLQGALRVAGTAEFAGFDLNLNARRVQNLRTLLKQALPTLDADWAKANAWCGLRPMSADGVAIIGATPVSNLFVNTGHGPLGWTTAAGSADLLAHLMAGRRPFTDPAPYALARFSN